METNYGCLPGRASLPDYGSKGTMGDVRSLELCTKHREYNPQCGADHDDGRKYGEEFSGNSQDLRTGEALLRRIESGQQSG